jgi:hypothetical protein
MQQSNGSAAAAVTLSSTAPLQQQQPQQQQTASPPLLPSVLIKVTLCNTNPSQLSFLHNTARFQTSLTGYSDFPQEEECL